MTMVTSLKPKVLFLGLLALFFTGCSNTAVPMGQSTSSLTQAHALPQADPACPSSGILVTAGNNGTYHVAVGDSCELFTPLDINCTISSGGVDYDFNAPDPSGLGKWTDNGENGTFKRTKTGDVVISVEAYPVSWIFKGCVRSISGSEFGSVTLD